MKYVSIITGIFVMIGISFYFCNAQVVV